MKLSYEIRIGILATITLIVLIVGYKFLKGSNLFDNNKTYKIEFDNVQQLAPAAPVFARGIKVGTVLKVKLAPENPDKVIVTIDIKGDILLPKNAKAVLTSTGLLEGKVIDLRFDHHCTNDCIESGGTINSEVESMLSSMLPRSEIEAYAQTIGNSLNKVLDSSDKKAQMNVMANDLKNTLHNLNLISQQMNSLLASNTKQINSTLSGLSSLSTSLAANTKSIDQSLTNLASITSQIKNANVDQLINHSDATIKSLNQTAQEASKSLQKINELVSSIQNGSGTASKLIKDPELYNNLQSTSKNLDKLIIDLKMNPGRYVNFSVFPGKKQKTQVQ